MKKKPTATPKAPVLPPIPTKPIADKNKDVHTEHCCVLHGCKYAEDNFYCTVATRRKPQSHPCEYCWQSGIKTLAEVYAIAAGTKKTCPNCGHPV